MDKIEHNIHRAEEAMRIVNSELYTGAFEMVRQSYLKTWEGLPTADSENAADIHRRLKCLADVQKVLTEVINTGKLAQRELTAREKAAKLARGVVNAFATSSRKY